jgi:hypothetical protein
VKPAPRPGMPFPTADDALVLATRLANGAIPQLMKAAFSMQEPWRVSTNPHERLISVDLAHPPIAVPHLLSPAACASSTIHRHSGGFSIGRWQSLLGAACRLRASQLEVDVGYKFGSAGPPVSK